MYLLFVMLILLLFHSSNSRLFSFLIFCWYIQRWYLNYLAFIFDFILFKRFMLLLYILFIIIVYSKDYLCQFVHNIISQLLKLSMLFHITVSSHCLRISYYFIKFIILNIKFYSSSFVFLLKKQWTLDKRIHQISII